MESWQNKNIQQQNFSDSILPKITAIIKQVNSLKNTDYEDKNIADALEPFPNSKKKKLPKPKIIIYSYKYFYSQN